MSFIKVRKLSHEFSRLDENGEVQEVVHALNRVDLDIEQGQFIAVLGHNGSGKSTLAKHFNVLLHPTEGALWVDGMDALDEDYTLDIRRTAGMVFQNPDNQMVAGIVEEEVAFGPENIGIPTEEIWERVKNSLEAVGMTAYRYQSPSRLSGGQKQRVAIAGIVAMEPKCIILDESTAMLDPRGRQEVLQTVLELNKKKGVTVILITHYMEEVTAADRLFVMNDGEIAMHGTPREIFGQAEKLEELGLTLPQITRLARELNRAGIPVPPDVLTREELVNAICQWKYNT